MSNNIGCYHPFTATQWQELEQQALIYKYMQSGIPIPSELLLSIQRSGTNFFLNSTTNPFTHPTIGWSFAQMGNGRRTEDAEPGRCKRTDGKKWRCSKEATPDSKYCERHMHRGKNRSRKPVEISLATNNNNATITTTPSFSKASSSYPQYPYNLMYPHPHQPHNTTNFSSTDKDYKDYSFMTERESPWELKPLMLGEPRKREEEEEEKKNKHCFVLGADFRLEKPVKERDFFDDWPGRNKGTTSWMGLDGESSTQGSAYSKTQNSISLPMGLHNFLQWFVTISPHFFIT